MDHFRTEKKDRKWLNREAQVEEQPPAPEDLQDEEQPVEGAPTPSWMISRWLREQVAKNPEEKRTYDLIVRKARSKKGYAEVAASAGMTENQLNNRVHRLKAKYLPLRQKFEKDRRDRILLWWGRAKTALKFAAVAAAIGLLIWFVLGRRLRDEIRPDPGAMPPGTASAQPEPTFDQALPTEPSATPTSDKPPTRDKPPTTKPPK